MSELDRLKRLYGEMPPPPLTEQQQAQRRAWAALGALAQQYPELASAAEYQRYQADPEQWLRDRRGEWRA